MRWTSLSLWLPAFASALTQVPSDNSGRLLIWERNPTAQYDPAHAVPIISHEAVRLIIARRLGVDQFHSSEHMSTEDLQAVKKYGGSGGLFEDRRAKRSVVLLLSCQAQHHDKNYLEPYTFETAVKAIPSLKKTEELLYTYTAQLNSLELSQPLGGDDGMLYMGKKVLIHQITASTNDPGSEVERYQKAGYDVILLVSPRRFVYPSKWESKTSYGYSETPSNSHGKRQIQEQPLEENTDDRAPPAEAITPFQSNDTSALRGILPFCYSTKEKCETTTRNCTGHGSCKVAYTQKDSPGDESGVPCYACACTPTVRENKSGTKKTTVWGGPACQKQDVVAPFWLLAGFTVLMVFLVSWGIGTILTMGEEELPSVIGAGVSGVPRR